MNFTLLEEQGRLTKRNYCMVRVKLNLCHHSRQTSGLISIKERINKEGNVPELNQLMKFTSTFWAPGSHAFSKQFGHKKHQCWVWWRPDTHPRGVISWLLGSCQTSICVRQHLFGCSHFSSNLPWESSLKFERRDTQLSYRLTCLPMIFHISTPFKPSVHWTKDYPTGMLYSHKVRLHDNHVFSQTDPK